METHLRLTREPRVVFGMPAYKRADMLAETLESLLSQTYPDFAIVITDDAPSPEVSAIVESYAARDTRITYEPNAVRLGMIGNWRQAFARSRERYPGSEYFAWVSDHDMWHPRWLESLVGVLDAQRSVVMAYPLMYRVYPSDARRRIARIVETVGITRPQDRLRLAIRRMTAGNAIYGLFRASALAQAGVFRPVVAPDRQVLLELSLLGEFRHVPEFLWYREVSGAFSYQRQRRMFFPTHVPWHTYLPANLQHFAVVLWDFAVRGRGRPRFGRLAGARYATLQLWYSTVRDITRGDAPWRAWLRSARPAGAESARATE